MHRMAAVKNMFEPAVKSDGIKERVTQTDLYQALFPMYHLGKLCGIFPVRFVEYAVGRYRGRLNVFDMIYSLCLLVVLVGTEFWGLWRDLRDGWEHSTRLKSKTAVIATCSDVFGVISLTAVSIGGAAFRWKHMRTIMEKLVEADEKLGIVAPKKTRRFTIYLTILNVSYLVGTSILDVCTWHHETKLTQKMHDKGPINYLPMYFMYAVIIVMDIQFGVFAYNIGQRFVRLNKILESILSRARISDHFRKDLGLAGTDLREQQAIGAKRHEEEVEPKLFRKSRTIVHWCPAIDEKRTYAENISELIIIHSSLCDTVTFVNSAFGVVVLAVTLSCMLHLIITPYFLILEASGRHDLMFLLLQIMWTVFHICRMLIIVQPTYSTVSEAKRTAVLVSQLLASISDVEARKQLEIFSLQLLHRPLEFSACGLFSLDRALITSIAGAVTTYLVILIQFQKADDTKGDADVIRNVSLILKNASSIQNLTGLRLGS